MKIATASILIIVACLYHLVQSAPAGVAMAIDNELIVHTKNYLLPIVLKTINSVALPEIAFDNGHVNDIVLNLGV